MADKSQKIRPLMPEKCNHEVQTTIRQEWRMLLSGRSFLSICKYTHLQRTRHSPVAVARLPKFHRCGSLVLALVLSGCRQTASAPEPLTNGICRQDRLNTRNE